MDTIHDSEEIKWELWKVIYGVWNHIKNSGEFEDVDNLTLEWVGLNNEIVGGKNSNLIFALELRCIFSETDQSPE